MIYLPDTNACAHFFRGEPGLAAQWSKHIGDIRLSVLVLAELRFGAAKVSSVRHEKHIAALLAAVPVEPLSEADAGTYARLSVHLETRGVRIGAIDSLIAAQALRLGATVVTHNLREFRRVPGLRVEDWQSAV